MRKFDKKLNILKANLLSEQRYAEEKNPLNEGWKTNVAAGLASIAGGAGANAQAQQAPQQNQGTSIQQAQGQQQDKSGVADPFNVDKSGFIGQTKPIFKIQTGVQDGKTGKPSVYVYHKDPNDPSFNVATDRETVYTQNLDQLRKTVQYQDYLKRMNSQQNPQQGQQVAVREAEKKN